MLVAAAVRRMLQPSPCRSRSTRPSHQRPTLSDGTKTPARSPRAAHSACVLRWQYVHRERSAVAQQYTELCAVRCRTTRRRPPFLMVHMCAAGAPAGRQEDGVQGGSDRRPSRGISRSRPRSCMAPPRPQSPRQSCSSVGRRPASAYAHEGMSSLSDDCTIARHDGERPCLSRVQPGWSASGCTKA